MSARTRVLVLLAALVALSASGSAFAAAPTNLHPFLLRADESRETEFSRTPAFAWNPVRSAVRYEFQLSTSSSFRENGIVYADTSLTTPVAAPALTLPWISGTPHALYARVRAILPNSATDWSTPYGFDMEAASIPAPLPSQPGLLRWTPVDGAVGYQVWFVDIPKTIDVKTNVADEREFYSFHQSGAWLSNVRWRVRAMRNILNDRLNGLPAVSFGEWSPVYSSVNPPFSLGQLRPQMTVSDVVSNGTASAPAHKLMPAFVFGGNASSGFTGELYRVHVYTDKRCVNRVYSSAIIGSPAYAPRYSGPLQLPTTSAGISAARSSYLSDGLEGTSYGADNFKIPANESLDKVKLTSGLPAGTEVAAAPTTTPAPTPGPTPTPTPTPAPASPTGAKASIVELIVWTSDGGPPIGLWDTDWDHGGGYYWTVVPVEAVIPGAASTILTGAGGALGGTTLPVANSNGFSVGDSLMVGSTGISETATITAVTAGTITITPALKLSHGPGETVVRTSGNIIYVDKELGQDACAAGRVLRFGKESEPALTAGGEPFISGLSPNGKLASASTDPAFSGNPLVAWTAALGADVYAVQWSKTNSPFKPETDPATTATGMMTLNTTALLPLEPGNWYYRVRGYNFALPLEGQAMSWSTPQRIVVAQPTFVIVGEDPSEKVNPMRTLSSRSAGISIKLPKSFSQNTRATASVRGYKPLGRAGSTLRVTAREAGGAALFVQTSPDRTAGSHSEWARTARASAARVGASRCAEVSLAAGAAVRCTGTKGSQASVVYLLQHRGVTYTLTFAGKPSHRSADAARFAAAARSLRFTR